MPFRIPDILKQLNRTKNVTKEDFFFAVDSADINHVISGKSSELGIDQATPINAVGVTGLTANIRFIVDNPYSLHPAITADLGVPGQVGAVGTGDIVRVVEFGRRDTTPKFDGTVGATYEILVSAGNTGMLTVVNSHRHHMVKRVSLYSLNSIRPSMVIRVIHGNNLVLVA